MTTYEPAMKKRTLTGNEQRVFGFPNGYSASVIRGPYTYGGPEGLFELAVLNPHGEIDYSTPITNDVIGYLTEDDVQATLAKIAALRWDGRPRE